jgi:hypothetical protein
MFVYYIAQLADVGLLDLWKNPLHRNRGREKKEKGMMKS